MYTQQSPISRTDVQDTQQQAAVAEKTHKLATCASSQRRGEGEVGAKGGGGGRGWGG